MRRSIAAFHNSMYHPGNVVVSVAGKQKEEVAAPVSAATVEEAPAAEAVKTDKPDKAAKPAKAAKKS